LKKIYIKDGKDSSRSKKESQVIIRLECKDTKSLNNEVEKDKKVKDNVLQDKGSIKGEAEDQKEVIM